LLKTCTKCKRELPFSEFSPNKPSCKKCRAIYQRAYILTDDGKSKKIARESTDEYRAWKKRWQEKYQQTGKGKEVFKKGTKKYNHTDKGKANIARFNNKRRARVDIISTLTAEEWEAIKKQYKHRCVYCNDIRPLTMDHIIPLSKGGHHIKENILPACATCNNQKRDKPVLQQILAMAAIA
jgi:5-methylcytosine-specific restriction endonuclease McrA